MDALKLIAGLLGPALIAFLVYRYRSVITYDLVSLSQTFRVEDGSIVISDEWPRNYLTLEEIRVKNQGWRNLSDVRIHLERTPSLLSYEIYNTTSVGKRTVSLNNDGEDVEISIQQFPRSEEIVINLSYASHPSSRYRDVKGASGSYRVERLLHWEVGRKNVFFFIFCLSLGIGGQVLIAIY